MVKCFRNFEISNCIQLSILHDKEKSHFGKSELLLVNIKDINFTTKLILTAVYETLRTLVCAVEN